MSGASGLASTLDGRTQLHWESIGDGDPVLLIMGLGLSGGAWWRTVPVLARRLRVITFDNRGVGRSHAFSHAYTTDAMADDAATVLEAAGVERAHVYGISLGGMVAQKLALRHPQRVRSLVLGATSPGGPRACARSRGHRVLPPPRPHGAGGGAAGLGAVSTTASAAARSTPTGSRRTSRSDWRTRSARAPIAPTVRRGMAQQLRRTAAHRRADARRARAPGPAIPVGNGSSLPTGSRARACTSSTRRGTCTRPRSRAPTKRSRGSCGQREQAA